MNQRTLDYLTETEEACFSREPLARRAPFELSKRSRYTTAARYRKGRNNIAPSRRGPRRRLKHVR